MIDFDKQVELFVNTVKEEITTEIIVGNMDDVRFIQVKNLFIILYPYGANRKENREAFQTIHIDLDYIYFQRHKVINRLKSMLGYGKRIYARETVVARIDKKVCMDFQGEHHLHVAMPGKYRYGLFYKGELVSAAIFSGGRKMLDQPEDYRSFELIHFCHKADVLVIGGVSKLIKHFVKDFKPSDIVTSADLDWCQRSSLEQINFQNVAYKAPMEFVIKDGKRIPMHEECSLYDKVKNSGTIKLRLQF